jgi:hypothetical protein
MNPDQIFGICNLIALSGWLVLIFLPGWYSSDKFIIGIIITLLAIVYTSLIINHFSFGNLSNFGSLAGIRNLFEDPFLLLAGWVHYLAFDLLAGIFIRKNAVIHGVSHWIVIPCLVLTFLLGPVGLLLYLVIRFVSTRNYFEINF